MNWLSFAIILFTVFCNNVFAQQSANKTSLLISNCKADEDVCEVKEIFKYNFEAGEFVSKEKILESGNLPNNLENSTIYKNRYIITEFADVIDIEKKKDYSRRFRLSF